LPQHRGLRGGRHRCDGETEPVAWVFDYDASRLNVFSKLARYQDRLPSRVENSLRELRKQQAARIGKP